MKIERVNENQIRCTLTSFDLSVRNLNLRELAYGTEKARNLFREMIQKASNEVGFEAEDIPLMVEAIPLSNESVMLIITKIEDPEELDTRFSKFSPSPEDEGEDLLSSLASELLEEADGLLNQLASPGSGGNCQGGSGTDPATGTEALRPDLPVRQPGCGHRRGSRCRRDVYRRQYSVQEARDFPVLSGGKWRRG